MADFSNDLNQVNSVPNDIENSNQPEKADHLAAILSAGIAMSSAQ